MKSTIFTTIGIILIVFSLFISSTLAYDQQRAQDRTYGPYMGTGTQGDQNQIRLQDPSTHEDIDDFPEQNRDQDRDRIQDPITGSRGGITIIDSSSTRSTPIQDRDQDTLRDVIRDRERIYQNEATNMPSQNLQQIYEKQNKLRIAAATFRSARPYTGNIGPDLERVGYSIENSVQNSIRNEEQIRERNTFTRFLAGGNEEAADNLLAQTNRYQEQIQELERLRANCEYCHEDVDRALQEQIRNMEQERYRLERLAQEEKENKGLFGWIWK